MIPERLKAGARLKKGLSGHREGKDESLDAAYGGAGLLSSRRSTGVVGNKDGRHTTGVRCQGLPQPSGQGESEQWYYHCDDDPRETSLEGAVLILDMVNLRGI